MGPSGIWDAHCDRLVSKSFALILMLFESRNYDWKPRLRLFWTVESITN